MRRGWVRPGPKRVEDAAGARVLAPDQDSVVFDRPDPDGNGRLHEFFNLQSLSVPIPPPVPPNLIPPLEETYRGEVEVGSTDVSAAAVAPLPGATFFVDEVACDGPQTPNPDGTDSVNPDLAGAVEPRYLQFQDGRPTDEAYPFPD